MSVSVFLFSTFSLIGTLHNPLSSLHPFSTASFFTRIKMSLCQWTVTPPSPEWKIVVYPASDSLQTDKSEFSFSSGRMSSSRACLFNFELSRNALFDVLAVSPVGMLTVLFDSLVVSSCSSHGRQKLEVAAESNTAVSFLLFLFAIFLNHFAAIGFTELAASRPLSNWILLSCGVGLVRLGKERLLCVKLPVRLVITPGFHSSPADRPTSHSASV